MAITIDAYVTKSGETIDFFPISNGLVQSISTIVGYPTVSVNGNVVQLQGPFWWPPGGTLVPGGAALALFAAYKLCCGPVQSIVVQQGGAGYTAPTASLSGGGGGSGCVLGTPVLSGGVITSIPVVSTGSGYTQPPSIVIVDANGTGAVAVPLMGGAVSTDVVTYSASASWLTTAAGAAPAATNASVPNWQGQLEPGIGGFVGFNAGPNQKYMTIGVGVTWPVDGTNLFPYSSTTNWAHRLDNPLVNAVTSAPDGTPLTITGIASQDFCFEAQQGNNVDSRTWPVATGVWTLIADETNPSNSMAPSIVSPSGSGTVAALGTAGLVYAGTLVGTTQVGKVWQFSVTRANLTSFNITLAYNCSTPGATGTYPYTLQNVWIFSPFDTQAALPGYPVRTAVPTMSSQLAAWMTTPTGRTCHSTRWGDNVTTYAGETPQVDADDLRNPSDFSWNAHPLTGVAGPCSARAIPISAARTYAPVNSGFPPAWDVTWTSPDIYSGTWNNGGQPVVSVRMNQFGSGYTAPTATATATTVGDTVPTFGTPVLSAGTIASIPVATQGNCKTPPKIAIADATGVGAIAMPLTTFSPPDPSWMTNTNAGFGYDYFVAELVTSAPHGLKTGQPLQITANTDITFSGTVTLGSAVVTGVTIPAGVWVGSPISGGGIPNGAKITVLSPGTNSITMSLAATATATETISVGPWLAVSSGIDSYVVQNLAQAGPVVFVTSPTTFVIEIFGGGSPAEQFAGTLASGSPDVTGISSTANMAVGMSAALEAPGAAFVAGIPAGTTIAAITSATTLTLSQNATVTGLKSIFFGVLGLKANVVGNQPVNFIGNLSIPETGGSCHQLAAEGCAALPGSCAWVGISSCCSDAGAAAIAEIYRDIIPPGRKIHLEYTDEHWNGNFAFTISYECFMGALGAFGSLAAVGNDYAYVVRAIQHQNTFISVFNQPDVNGNINRGTEIVRMFGSQLSNANVTVNMVDALNAYNAAFPGVLGGQMSVLVAPYLDMKTGAWPNPNVKATVNATGGGATGGSLSPGTYIVAYTWLDTLTGRETTVGTSASLPFTVAAGNIPTVTLPALPAWAASMNLYLTPPYSDATLTGTLTNNSANVTGLSTAGLLAGMPITGTGIANNTSVLAITSGTTLTLTAVATTSGSESLTFTDPVGAELQYSTALTGTTVNLMAVNNGTVPIPAASRMYSAAYLFASVATGWSTSIANGSPIPWSRAAASDYLRHYFVYNTQLYGPNSYYATHIAKFAAYTGPGQLVLWGYEGGIESIVPPGVETGKDQNGFWLRAQLTHDLYYDKNFYDVNTAGYLVSQQGGMQHLETSTLCTIAAGAPDGLPDSAGCAVWGNTTWIGQPAGLGDGSGVSTGFFDGTGTWNPPGTAVTNVFWADTGQAQHLYNAAVKMQSFRDWIDITSPLYATPLRGIKSTRPLTGSQVTVRYG